MAEAENSRLSISEEKLRLALSEMEWRLKTFFNDQLRDKADSSYVTLLAKKLDELDRGDFSQTHKRALRDFVETTLSEGGDTKWKSIQRGLSVAAIALSILSLGFTAAILFHAGGGHL